jgi:hypothetical protein
MARSDNLIIDSSLHNNAMLIGFACFCYFISGAPFVKRRALPLLPAPLQARPPDVRRSVPG